jgi:hypothetical protein
MLLTFGFFLINGGMSLLNQRQLKHSNTQALFLRFRPVAEFFGLRVTGGFKDFSDGFQGSDIFVTAV